MKQALYIFKKEFNGYFISPIAYIVIAIFLIITGWFFFSTFFLYNQVTLRNFYSLLPLIFSFIIPAVTMRLFSEELNIGSYELLMTMPVTFQDIIQGKFMACIAFVIAMLIPTLAYPILLSMMGDLDWGPVVGGYLGAILLGGAFAAIGLFASSLTRNQIISFIVATAICFSLTLIDRMLFFLPKSLLGIFSYLGAGYHFQNFSKGIIDTRDVIYFLSVMFISLYGAKLSMQQKY
ncbi:MAG: ABC-2 transporter permease [Deltaproteobacteria bacterium]|nr:ABC-2 transporter permease [Deltaproteobacteria bacterium]